MVNGMKEYFFHNNLGPGDLLYQYTNVSLVANILLTGYILRFAQTGWTLWNISIGSLLAGSSMVLYDGSPFYPTPESFLKSLFKQRLVLPNSLSIRESI